MRIPAFVKEKDCLGFIAPSYGCDTEPYYSAFQNALRCFEALGFHTELGPNCYAGDGIGISSTPERCAAEVNEYFAKKGVDALISCGGGELMCEILDFVDFERIAKEEPKWFMGFSDNTNLTFLLATLCDTAAIYGPCAAAFGMEPWHASLSDAFDLLCGKIRSVSNYPLWEKESQKDEAHPLAPYHVTEGFKLRSVPDGGFVTEGRFLGGCLDCLANLVGTKFDRVADFTERYRQDGILWYLEACDLNVMGIRRALWQLDCAGWFTTAKGFLFGRALSAGEEMFGLDQYSAVCGVLRKYQVPIVMDIDIGHLPPMMPIVNGGLGKVAVTGNSISINYSFN